MINLISKAVGVLSLVTFMIVGLNAQKASPSAQATGTVGEATITIDYHQPGVKGREIWGGLVPYDNVWTWIFSKTWDTWGTNYDPKADVLRVKGNFEKREEPMERMTFTITDGKVSLHWADMVASVTVE